MSWASAQALEGKEEYLNSEKYEIKQWDWNARGNIRPIIERVNRIRRQNPALQSIRNIELYPIDNEAMLCYGKTTEDNSNIIDHRRQPRSVPSPVRLGPAPAGTVWRSIRARPFWRTIC